MFSTLYKSNLIFSVAFIISSANAFNLYQSKVLLCGKQLTLSQTTNFRLFQLKEFTGNNFSSSLLCSHLPSISLFLYSNFIDPCPGGQELPAGQTSSTDCVDCPPNTYKDPSLDTECQPCPPGFITVSPGSSMMSDCLRRYFKLTVYSIMMTF